jgi:hypothetical protein
VAANLRLLAAETGNGEPGTLQTKLVDAPYAPMPQLLMGAGRSFNKGHICASDDQID